MTNVVFVMKTIVGTIKRSFAKIMIAVRKKDSCDDTLANYRVMPREQLLFRKTRSRYFEYVNISGTRSTARSMGEKIANVNVRACVCKVIITKRSRKFCNRCAVQQTHENVCES